jgi:histidinol-phosphate phosphatase family protein
VNNNAAAVSLAINELARGREVIVSRGELVEIGGGFRVPEVIERSGGFLKAVGTTNRTRADDYARAVTPSTGLLLKVHPSNYRVQGFVEETSIEVLVGLGSRAGVPVMHDLGSGFLLRDGLAAPADEPRPQDSVAAGIDLVTWSGDKLLGGPQAGLLHGQREMIDRLRSNPLLRAFRVDKMTLAALEATLRLHLQPERALERIPALRMLSETATHVERRARLALEVLEAEARPHVTVRPVLSLVGGGTSPGVKLDFACVGSAAGRADRGRRARHRLPDRSSWRGGAGGGGCQPGSGRPGPRRMTVRPTAVFLDRDGTIIRDTGYPADPADVEIRGGAAEAVAFLNRASVPVIVVTNQSGIGRGMYDEEAFRAVQSEMERRLAAAGSRIDAVYHCPHAPDVGCECRKPALGLYRRASADLAVDLTGAVYAGDRARDVMPAFETGGTGLLVADESGRYDESTPEGCLRAPDLLTGLRCIMGDSDGP